MIHVPSLKTPTTVSISTGTTGLSSAIKLGGHTLCSVGMSTAWTNAVVSFQASTGSTATYRNVFTSTGGELTLTTTADRVVPVNPDNFRGFQFIKLRSGESTAAVAQGAARTLTLHLDALSAIK